MNANYLSFIYLKLYLNLNSYKVFAFYLKFIKVF